jgi:hypothetical protein
VVLANNAVYTMSGSAIAVSGDTSMITIAGNVGMGGLSGGSGGYVDGDPVADFVAGSFAGAPPVDPFPAAGGALVGAGDAMWRAERDFNGLPHGDPPDVGAYAFDPEGNPGWEIQAGFKEFPDDLPGGTGSGGETESGGSGSESAGEGSGTAGPGSAEGGPGSAEDGPGSAEAGTDDGGTTDGSGSGDGDADGCGCRQTGGRGLGALIGVLLACTRRRRR